MLSYNAAISACEEAKQSHKALELPAEMQQEGLEPNAIKYSAITSACEQAKQPDKALELLADGSREAWSPT